jgi:hypothetical protein
MVYRLVDIGGGVGSDSRGWIGVGLFLEFCSVGYEFRLDIWILNAHSGRA